ncbi:MAG: hypothetical protein ACJAXW_002560 [Candidatus Azotimanducaceae bacterium]|jgi:hypothetical protein
MSQYFNFGSGSFRQTQLQVLFRDSRRAAPEIVAQTAEAAAEPLAKNQGHKRLQSQH